MARIYLTPMELRSQSQEMANLKQEYDQLFQGVKKAVNDVNDNWSAGLANNFTSKITTASKSFEQISEMLASGSKAAESAAGCFESVDNALARIMQPEKSGIIGPYIGAAVQKDVLLDQETTGASKVFKDASEMMGFFEGDFVDKLDFLPSSMREHLKDLYKKGLKENLGKYEMITYDLIKDIESQDYVKAAKKFLKAIGKTEDWGENLSTAYQVNAIVNAVDSYIEYAQHPSVTNFLGIGWKSAVESALEVGADEAWNIVKHIPWISEYYDKQGIKSGGDAINHVYTEWTRIFFGDNVADGVKDYYSNNGGLWNGLVNGVGQICNEVKENGGFINNWVQGFKSILHF